MRRLRLIICCLLLRIGSCAAIAADEPAGELRIGASSIVINPELGSWVQGAGVTKRGEKQLDDMEALALFLDDGPTKLLLISCDLICLESAAVKSFREAISTATGVPARQVLITCTHQHSGPVLMHSNYYMPVDQPYLERLHAWLVQVSEQAVKSAQPGKLAWAKGTAAIGFNRRVCWANGTHSMHGDTTKSDFAGLEGPDDQDHLALFAVTLDDQPIAVLHHNTSHPTNFYGGGVFSADYPGVARKLIRKELGNIPVLYLNGAQGDIAMEDQLHPLRESGVGRMQRIGKLLAEETMRLCTGAKYHTQVKLAHALEDLQVAVRLPTPEEVVTAQKVLDEADKAQKQLSGMELIFAHGTVDLQRRFGENPVETIPIHVIRIGDMALVTQPCELYCQFGLDIKRRSPTPLTAVVGLADGYGGYCPTIYGILGGGYSGRPIMWTRLEERAGYKMVESAGPMLNKLWREGQ